MHAILDVTGSRLDGAEVNEVLEVAARRMHKAGLKEDEINSRGYTGTIRCPYTCHCVGVIFGMKFSAVIKGEHGESAVTFLVDFRRETRTVPMPGASSGDEETLFGRLEHELLFD